MDRGGDGLGRDAISLVDDCNLRQVCLVVGSNNHRLNAICLPNCFASKSCWLVRSDSNRRRRSHNDGLVQMTIHGHRGEVPRETQRSG